MTRYVGVDLHRRRSVVVVLDADGTECGPISSTTTP
jgi:hypothetical protein